MFQPYSICKDHLKAIWGGGVTYCKSGFFRSRNQRIARLVPFHTERKLGVSLKFNSYGTQLISPKTVGHFFFSTRLHPSLKCLDIKPQYVLNEKLICDENDPKFLHFAKAQLLMSLFIPYLCPLQEIC